ncbi:MFS transporter [Dokdonella sp.]|uniref:MFS transporter n=1 Tax=Dokdonella sp. TaxID=2291710 RepID=UPI003262F731
MDAPVKPPSSDTLFSGPWRNLAIGAVGLCSMIAFEAIGVAAGMPAVAAALDGVPLYALAFAGTLAGSVVAMVWSGHDCDRHGPFRSMGAGLLLFATGLLLAGLAGSMAMLIAGRILQGLGVGALGVALYVATARALPSALHPRLFALFSSAWVVPAVIGPAISGWIVDHGSWRWLFLGILVLLVPTAALILPPLRRQNEPMEHARSSWWMLPWSILAASASVTLSISAMAGSWAFAVVVASLAALLAAAAKLLPAGTLQGVRGLPTVIALRGLGSAAFFLCEAFIPLWLHDQRGWSITAAGAALSGGALSWSIGSHLQSRIIRDARRRAWLGHGFVLLCAGIAICAAGVLGVLPDWTLLVGWSIAGLGVGVSLPMVSVLTLKLAPRELQGTYSSAIQLCAALATSAALAGGGLMFSLLQATRPMAAFASVFAIALGIAALATVLAQRAYPDQPD